MPDLTGGWLVMRDPPDYPGKVTARLVTDEPTFYVLVADTMGELHAALPLGLVWSERDPADPPEVVEIWFYGKIVIAHLGVVTPFRNGTACGPP